MRAGTPAPRSRAWRKIIYRQMGIRNSLDQANAARAIANQEGRLAEAVVRALSPAPSGERV